VTTVVLVTSTVLVLSAVVVGVVRPPGGAGLLRRWGIVELDGDKARTASRYLRERRVLTLVVMVPALVVVSTLWVNVSTYELLSEASMYLVLGSVLVSMLVAEWWAGLRRPQASTRVAVLRRRRVSDLVPTYALVLYLAMTALAIAADVAGSVVRPWAQRMLQRSPPPAERERPFLAGDLYRDLAAIPPDWPFLAGTAACLAAVAGVVWLAVTRPMATEDDRVDAVLRARSARVAVGLGTALTATITQAALARLRPQSFLFVQGAPDWVTTAGTALYWVTVLVWPLGIVIWIWVTTPPRRRLARTP